MLQRDPARLLPHSITSSLEAAWTDGASDGYGWDGYVVNYEFSTPVPSGDLEAACELADAMMQPAPTNLILKELARLRLLTVSRDVGSDMELLFAAYAAELRDYPADVITEVLRGWPKTERFWPSLAELTVRLERLVKPRRALRRALRKGYSAPTTSPDWMPPTEDEKTAVTEYLKRHGFTGEVSRPGKPLEKEPFSAEDRKRITAETRNFRLPDEDDPRVQARLREMGAAA